VRIATRLRARSIAIAIVAAAGITNTVGAAPPQAQERALSDGVDRPIHDYSSEGDSTSIELNPALLSAAPTFDIGLLGYQAVSDFVRGSGFGAFIATNLRLGLALGFGAQFLQPGLGRGLQDFARGRNPSATKLSWAVAGGLGSKGSFGISVSGLRSDNQWLRRPDVDLGLMYRIRNYGSLGVVARLGPGDLRGADFRSEASITGELSLRPLGTRMVEIAGGVRSLLARAEPGQGLDAIGGSAGLFPRGRIALRYRGVALLGEVEQVQTTILDPATLQSVRTAKAIRGAVALELGWDFVRARAGLHAGVSDGVDGVGFEAHVGTLRQDRVYWARRVDAERIDFGEVDDETSLVEMLQRLDRAERAGERTVLVVHPTGKHGWATSHELREALIRVRNAGGHVFAYLEGASLGEYYVASAAERIYMHTAGSLETYGISGTRLYFKDALAKLGVRAEVVRIDEYKTAGEPFAESGPTAPSRAQETALQVDSYAQIIGDIARARGLSRTRVRELFDDAPHAPTAAVELGLVDEVVYRDQLLARVSDVIGADVDYKRFDDTRHGQPTWGDAPYLAVVLVEGTIIDGESRFIPILGLRFVGGDTIVRTLRKLREDRSCKGILLRVNSPGGSALASDVIWREVELTREAHEKESRFAPPILVSMGDVAASGGYYVAMGARPVLADPLTVTGSIGVISIHPDLSGLLAKLGIAAVTTKQGKNPDIGEPWRAYTDDQRGRVERSIRTTYDLFRTRVADGRGLSMERVHELARGHVYSGVAAKKLGLVDELGGLDDAIERLRKLTNVRAADQLELRVLPHRVTLVDLILEAFGVSRRDREPTASTRLARRRARLSGELALPPVLDAALARLPLSLIFLEPGKAHAILPWAPQSLD
jgi:protease IV